MPSPSAHPERLPDDPQWLKGEVKRLELLVQKLTLQLARQQRARFGTRSERYADGQASLIEAEFAQAERPAAPSSKPAAAAANQGLDRSLPAHLPHEQLLLRPPASETHHDAQGRPCGCTACGGRLRALGHDVSHHLEYVPGRFKVIRTVREKQVCTACEAIWQAPAPSRPIPRGLAGASLLSHVMVSKYCDHLPLHRLSRIFAREGVPIERATMAGWVEQVHTLLEPLVAALGRHVLQGAKVHADDTPVKVLAPGRGKTLTGRLWVYVRDDRPSAGTAAPAAWFRYSPDRKGEHPRAHLRGFGGILQADAYAGWGGLYEQGVTEAACWAHARRPWWDLYEQHRDDDGLAAQALRRIRALYAIEADIRGRPPHVRRAQRQARAAPLLQAFHAWLHDVLAQVSAKSELANAARYSLARWPALTRYVDDGRIEIDNSAAERAIRALHWGATTTCSWARTTAGTALPACTA